MNLRLSPWAAVLAALTISCAAKTPGPGASSQPTSSAAAAAVPTPAEELFLGSVTTTSPDGATPYGPPRETVARRKLVADGAQIEEHVFYEGKLQRTVLTRRAGEAAWDAKDDAGTFTGVIRFEGDDAFRWARWSYEITMANGGGTITGTGERKDGGFTTTKLFSAGGAPRAKITETFRVATEAELAAKLTALESAPAPAKP